MEYKHLTQHVSVLLNEVLNFVPSTESGICLDCTFGGGGHLNALLEKNPSWTALALDHDPLAYSRWTEQLKKESTLGSRVQFFAQNFRFAPTTDSRFHFAMADLGVSSFQLDPQVSGMSLKSDLPVDFRMDTATGPSFYDWLGSQAVDALERVFRDFGEEPRAAKLAQWLKSAPQFSSAKMLAEGIAHTLGYSSKSRIHPATRAFQALRIAVNDELGALKDLLAWVPLQLNHGGRFAVITFHSLEDRLVKTRFRSLAETGEFDILTSKPVVPTDAEVELNPRSRSAKLRVLEKR